ncbi:phage tail spike protein [Cytobacillus kochii]|uniref:phage tail spike protein n=1 Tax=Cytobacillus kochii TaxID=859143 RepID=UPI00402A64DE
MTELFIFNQDDQLLTIISEDSGLISAPYRIEINKVPETPFSFTVEADTEDAKYVLEENKVVFRDHEGDLRLFVIKELDDSDGMDGPLTTATCEPEFLELAEHIILDKRFSDKTARVALDAALEGTGWIGEVEVDLGLASTNFYRMRSVDAIWEIIKVWGGEFKDVVEFDEENNIVARKIKIIQRLGKDTGQRFEIDHNTTEIGRQVLSYPVTAMYGWGASLETEGGGNTRYIDFGDVEMSIANGDPFDKPKGQKWVGDPEAFASYRRIRDGVALHRFGQFSNQDYEDPEELLWATWDNLQNNNKPVVNYRLSVDLFDEQVNLGDTAIAIDRKFARPIEIQSRIIAMEYDLLDIDGTTVVEMGQFLDLEDDRLEELKKEVEQIRDRPQQVTEGSFPDIKPTIPINVEAISGMGVIQLYWDYGSSIYVKHYEVYGSQLKDFVPDTQHLLWRGNTSGFLHSVGTDQVWYYRIRAVNQHGTPSDWSVQVMGATHRVVSDDILFGPDIAAELRELSKTADILADGTIYADMIRQDVYDQIQADSKQYTDAEITATEVSLMSELANKAGFDYVDGKIYLVNEELLNKVDNGVYQNKILQIDNSLDGLSLRAQNVEANVNTLTNEVDSAVIQIANVDIKANQISQNVSSLTQTVNEQGTALSRAESSLDLLSDEIELKTQQIDILGDRMTQSESSIRLLSDDIELKVDRDGIIGAINVQPGDVKIHTRLLDVGDFTNLIDNGDFEDDTVGQMPSGWINDNEGVTTIGVVDQTSWSGNNGSSKCLGLWASDVRNVDAQQERIIKVQEGDELYFELDYRFNNLVGPGSLSYGVRTYDLKKQHLSWTTVAYATTKTYAWTKLSGSYKVPAGVGYIRLRVSFTNNGETTNRAWVDNLVVRRKNNSHLIVDGSINANLMAANSITAQNGALANASITRANLQDAIIGTAQIDDLAVTAAKIASINADKINAGAIRGIDIYGSQFRSSDGLTQLDITGGNVRLRQNSGQYVLINPNGLFGYNSNNSQRFKVDATLVTSSAIGTSNNSVYLGTNHEARVVNFNDIPGDGLVGSYRYLPMRASGYYGNYINVNSAVPGGASNLYLRPLSAGEVRVTANETTDLYRDIRVRGVYGDYFDGNTQTAGTNLYIRPVSGAEVRITRSGSTSSFADIRANNLFADAIDVNALDGGIHLYLRTVDNGYVKVTRSGTTEEWRGLQAREVENMSSIDLKTNIKHLPDNGLKVIRGLSFVEYDLKDDIKNGIYFRNVGLIAEYSPDVTGRDGKAINLYFLSSYIGKAVQELDKEINWLKMDNQYLKQKVNQYEDRIAHLEELLNVA